MGVTLPKPVISSIRERGANEHFKFGSGCVNGYRDNMEDAHLAYFRDSWGFFGVFDGHVNDHCSIYLEHEWKRVCDGLNVPITDERMKELALEIDKKYLSNNPQGGSTGTFFIAQRQGDKVNLQIGNVGDSRVLARVGGQCVALTNDHKPTLEEERRRIILCHGTVENGRVNGSLALSRAFGDADYKKNAEGDQITQQVIALPDVTRCTVDYGKTDFAVLACDGVFEGNFSNEEVVEYVGKELEKEDDLAVVSYNVCLEAIKRGSKDNISCMIVQFKNGGTYGANRPTEFVPGPMAAPGHNGFRRAYWGMATKGGMTPAQCLEKRYDQLIADCKKKSSDVDTQSLESELELFRDGPPASLQGAERSNWFNSVVQSVNAMGSADDPTSTLLQLQQRGIPLKALVDALQNNDDE